MAIELAVAGMGRRGRQWADVVRTHPDYELAACVDTDEDAVQRAGADFELSPKRRFTGLAHALDDASCDAVIVATPPNVHADACKLALSRDIGVLVEKPFTTRLIEAARLVGLAEERGAPLVVGQNYRYMRRHRAVRRVIREGSLGRVGMTVAHYYHGSDHLPPSHARMSHSVLWGPAAHHIDALRYVHEKRITGVMAQLFTTPWGGLPDGASLHALFQLDGGIRSVYSATYESKGHEFFERGQEYYERLVGERATLHVVHRWLILCEQGKRPRVVRRGGRPETEESLLLGQLRRGLLDGEEPDSSGRANLETVAALEACLLSSAEGRWVNPQELLAEAAAPEATR